MEQYLIGVDLGTSCTKAAIYRIDGTLVAEASQEVPLYYPEPGVVEQENQDFYDSAAQTVSRCMKLSGIDARQVKAIAFDSQMAGIGSVDEDFQPVTRYDSWLDMRCQPFIDQMKREAGDRVTELTGCPPTCNHGPKIMWWMNEKPHDYQRIVSFLTPSAYVAGTMAGLKGDQAFMDYTFIHFSGLSDASSGSWSQELCERFGVDINKMPEIVEPWKVVGEVRERAAADFGLVAGIPISAGAGDTAANALGAGIVKAGMVFDVAGTAAVLAGCTDRYIADRENRALLTMRSVVPGLWNPLAYIAGGGIALKWFRDQFYSSQQNKKQLNDDELYEKMIGLADQVSPGANGLFFSPHLGGRICPASPAMRGAWLGFSFGHVKADFCRAILESVAFEYAYYLRILGEMVEDLELIETRVVGGGARSSIWNQIKSDVLNVPYQRLRRSEFGTWGCALIAGKSVGIYDDLAVEASHYAELDGLPVYPDLTRHKIYKGLTDKYISMQKNLEGWFSRQNRKGA